MTLVLADLAPGGRVSRITVGRKTIDDAPRVLAGSTLSLDTQSVGQLQLRFADPDLGLLASKRWALRTTVAYAGLALEVATQQTDDERGTPVLTVDLRDQGAQRMKRARGDRLRTGLSATDNVALDVKAAGLRFVGQSTTRRDSIVRAGPLRGNRDLGDSDYDVAVRLAAEEGFVFFVAAGTAFFAKPSWLLARAKAAAVPVAWGGKPDAALLRQPRCRRTADDPSVPTEVTLSVTDSLALTLPPGAAIKLSGVPTFDGVYLVTALTLPMDHFTAASVTCSTPVDPIANDPGGLLGAPPPGAVLADGTVIGGAGIAAPANLVLPDVSTVAGKLIAFCQAQLGKQYVYGASGPDTWDCSGLVSGALTAAGVGIGRLDAAAIGAHYPPVPLGQEQPGDLALFDSPVGHIGVVVGKDTMISAPNSNSVVRYDSISGFGGYVYSVRVP